MSAELPEGSAQGLQWEWEELADNSPASSSSSEGQEDDFRCWPPSGGTGMGDIFI